MTMFWSLHHFSLVMYYYNAFWFYRTEGKNVMKIGLGIFIWKANYNNHPLMTNIKILDNIGFGSFTKIRRILAMYSNEKNYYINLCWLQLEVYCLNSPSSYQLNIFLNLFQDQIYKF